MSIPSLTVFINDYGQQVANMYREEDGGIEVHGWELANFLKGISLGYPRNPSRRKRYVDNMEYLATQAVAHFKTGFGKIYLQAAQPIVIWDVPLYIIEVVKKKGAPPTIEVHSLRKWSPDAVFKGTATHMLKWIELIKEGFIDEGRTVVRVIIPNAKTPGRRPDFGDYFPYLYFEEPRLGRKIRYGSQMSKLIHPYSRSGLHPHRNYAIIVCVGSRDDLDKRIKQARRFAAVPSALTTIGVVFWASKWDEPTWKKYEHFFSPRKVILKQVGKDPIDLISGEPLDWGSDRLDAIFNATAQHDGLDVS